MRTIINRFGNAVICLLLRVGKRKRTLCVCVFVINQPLAAFSGEIDREPFVHYIARRRGRAERKMNVLGAAAATVSI